MGNVNEFMRKANIEVDFVGREKEIKKIKQLIKTKRLINLFGMKKIGTSALVREVISSMVQDKDFLYWYKDCDRLENHDAVMCELVKIINACMEQSDEMKRSDMKHDDDLENSFHPCDKCRECQRNVGKNGKCKAIESAVKNVTQTFVDFVNTMVQDRVIIILDNISVILNSSVKDTFMTFIKNSTSWCERLSFILTSTDQIQFPSVKYFTALEIEPMEKADILTLLQNKVKTECAETCEEGDHEPDEHFTGDDKVYIEVIADLCEGLPLAAITVGTILCEDGFMMKPAYAVEILITNRLQGLSPENYPTDDRAETYTAVLDALNPRLANFCKRLNDKMIGTEFSMGDTAAVFNDQGNNAPTDAIRLNEYIKPLLHKCVMSAKRFSRDKKVKLHGILRDCIYALDSVEHLPEDDAKKFKDTIMKAMRENADRAGLKHISDDVLAMPKLLEQAIKAMVLDNDERESEIRSGKGMLPCDGGHESVYSFGQSTDSLRSKDVEKHNHDRCTHTISGTFSEFQLHDFQDIRQESIACSSLSGPTALPHFPTQESRESPSLEMADFGPLTLDPRYPPTSVLSGDIPQSSYPESREKPCAQEHAWSIRGS